MRTFLFYLTLALVLTPFLFVFAYMVTTSLKSPLDITSPDFKVLFTPTLDNYRKVFAENEFLRFGINSAVIATGSTAIALLLGAPAAYAIAHRNMPRFAVAILSSRITPGITFLIPWFIIFSRLGWVDTYRSLILAHLLINLPLAIWMLISYFEDVSPELIDAARVDGATSQRTFWSIVLPLTRGGIAATAILAFIFSWNNFMFSVVLALNTTKTLPVAVFNFMSYGNLEWGPITAAATIMTLPVVVLALLVQKQIVNGLSVRIDV
mgnify:FL=1